MGREMNLFLVFEHVDQVILACHWSILVTRPQYSPLICQHYWFFLQIGQFSGPEPLHWAGASPRTAPWPHQGHHVANPLRGGLPPQPPDSPQGPEASKYPRLQRWPGQAGWLWAGEDIRLQFTADHCGEWRHLSCSWHWSSCPRWSRCGTGHRRSSSAPPTPPRWTSGAAAASWASCSPRSLCSRQTRSSLSFWSSAECAARPAPLCGPR